MRLFPPRSRVACSNLLQQTGVIGFSKAFLNTFLKLNRTPLEIVEGIDMLRVLEHGYSVQVVMASRPTIGVDTPEELARALEVLENDPFTGRYLEGSE